MLLYLTSLANTLLRVDFTLLFGLVADPLTANPGPKKLKKCGFCLLLFCASVCSCAVDFGFGTFETVVWFWKRRVGSRIPWPRGCGQETKFFVLSLYGQLFPHGDFNVFDYFDCNFQWLSIIFDGNGSCDFDDANNIDYHCMIKSQHVMNIFSALWILSWFLFWNQWSRF